MSVFVSDTIEQAANRPADALAMAHERSTTRQQRRAWGARAGLVPVMLVGASLCWLAVLAIFVPRDIRRQLVELSQTIEPATRAAADLQVALSTETASTRAFLLTGDRTYADAFISARLKRRDAHARLAALSHVGVPAVDPIVDDIDTALRRADQRLDALYSGAMSREEYIGRLSEQHERFTRITAAISSVHQSLRAEAGMRRVRIRDAVHWASLLALAGVVLGIVASLSVIRLGASQRASALRARAASAASERAHAEAEARRVQLEQVTAGWKRLVRGFTHDLKNPLGAADGYLYMLEKGTLGPLSLRQARAVSQARHNVANAIALARDLVDLGRADASDLDVRASAMDLCEVVRNVVNDYQAQADAKHLALRIELPGTPAILRSDPSRVSQVLGNLVNNAIKYTDAGSVTVRVGHRRSSDSRSFVIVDVADTGRGIAKEHHPRIFDEFERLDASDPSGCGIGLAISQRLALALGGTLTLESEPGRGSTFTLWLPDNHLS